MDQREDTVNRPIRHLWRRLLRWLHLPRGIHRAQLIAALACFAAPLALIPLARLQDAANLRPSWELVSAYPGGDVRQLALGRLGAADALYVLGCGSGLAVSIDGGESWHYANHGLPEGRMQSTRLLDLAVDGSHPGVMYAAVDSPATAPRPMLYWTVDGGLLWQPRANLGRERVRALAIDNGGNLYLATTTEVRRAVLAQERDARLSPQERFARGHDDMRYPVLANYTGQPHIERLVLAPPSEEDEAEGPTLLIGTRGEGLLSVPAVQGASADATSRYVREQAAVGAVCVLETPRQRLFAGTDRGLFVSEDAGHTWRALDAPFAGQRVASLLVPDATEGTVLAGGTEGVWQSLDAGASWERLGHGLGRAAVVDMALDARRSPAVLYAAAGGRLWRWPLVDE